jgi:hypothetical protein
MKDDIILILNKLKYTQEIIRLLKDESENKFGPTMNKDNLSNCINDKSDLELHISNKNDSEWKEVQHKKFARNQSKKVSDYRKHRTAFTPSTNNRFYCLSNYQDLALQSDGKKIKWKPLLESKNSEVNKHKIIILGDSHVRGCSEKWRSILGNAYSIIGISKPNAKIAAVIDYEYLKAENLTEKDVVICGGTKYVAKNETKEGLRSILKLVRLLSNTNVIITGVPHRFDLQEHSCVNKEVKLFNRTLQKNMKIFDYVQICNISENREHFTTHGLHMNFKGKLDYK